MRKIDKADNICLLYNCSECCNPVKINSLRLITERDNLPFIELKEMLILEKYPDRVKLKSYHCSYFNHKTGLCDNYSMRPEICQNTKCLAFQTTDRKKQLAIIKHIKTEKFIRIIFNKQEV